MKIIVKKILFDETPIELSVEPEKTTIIQFAQLYLEKLSRRYEYLIEKTKYTKRTEIISSDFVFYINYRSYYANGLFYSNPNILLSEAIKKSGLENNDDIVIHASLSLYETAKYPLKIYKTPSKLSKLCFFKIKDMLNEKNITKHEVKDVPPNDIILFPKVLTN